MVIGCPLKKSTLWRHSASAIASAVGDAGGTRRSHPATTAPITGVTGATVSGPSSYCLDRCNAATPMRSPYGADCDDRRDALQATGTQRVPSFLAAASCVHDVYRACT